VLEIDLGPFYLEIFRILLALFYKKVLQMFDPFYKKVLVTIWVPFIRNL